MLNFSQLKAVSAIILLVAVISCNSHRTDGERHNPLISTNQEVEETVSEILQKSIDYENLQWFYMDTSLLIIINFTDYVNRIIKSLIKI